LLAAGVFFIYENATLSAREGKAGVFLVPLKLNDGERNQTTNGLSEA
jgi:hypothetical protein